MLYGKSVFCLFSDFLLKMKFGETLYTQLTDRQLSIDKRLDLIEKMEITDSKQMIFDWLSGLVINRKK
jgi:hypothetical protein